MEHRDFIEDPHCRDDWLRSAANELGDLAQGVDPGSFGVFFLRADGANNPREGDCSAFGDLVLVDEEDCVGSFDSVSNPLG